MNNPNPTYDLFTGNNLKLSGMNLATSHANKVHDGWADKAYELLKQFVRSGRGEFMCEDVREYAYIHGLPNPPTSRAWGSLIVRASKKDKIIKHVGFSQVKNSRAHRANASVWAAA